jgi:hypothetical protein
MSRGADRRILLPEVRVSNQVGVYDRRRRAPQFPQPGVLQSGKRRHRRQAGFQRGEGLRGSGQLLRTGHNRRQGVNAIKTWFIRC